MNTYALRQGDRITVTRDGRDTDMTVYAVYPPGTAGTAVSAGPRIGAWTRPGGYGITFDMTTTGMFWRFTEGA